LILKVKINFIPVLEWKSITSW